MNERFFLLFKRPFQFQFRNLSTQSFSKVIDINSSISNNEISIYANILEQLPNLYSKLILTFESTNEVYDMESINRTIDICRLFSDRRYEPILQIFYNIFTAKSGTSRRCPVKKVIIVCLTCVEENDLEKYRKLFNISAYKDYIIVVLLTQFMIESFLVPLML